MQAFTRAPWADPPPVVRVEGIWVKSAYPTGHVKRDAQGRRRAAQRKQTRVVLTALGVWPAGHWDIRCWQLAAPENAAAWDAFWQALSAQGGTAETTHLGVSDGAAGLATALDLPL